MVGTIVTPDLYSHESIVAAKFLAGGFGVLKQLLHLSARVRQHEEEQEEERIRQSPTQTVLNCFMLGWFIIGKKCTGLI